MPSGIYVIRNTVSGKCYVGSAVNIAKRLARHMYMLRNSQHPSKHLQASFLKYGDSAFETGTLEVCEPELLLEREAHWIDALKAAYNKRVVPNNNLGVPASAAQKAAASERGKAPEQIARIAEGRNSSWKDPVKHAARVANMKAAWTDEKRAAVSERQKGVDKGQAARDARWAKPGASERASAALSKSWDSRLPRSEADIRRMVDDAGWVCEGMTGTKAGDRVSIFCEKHGYRKDVGVRNLQRGQGCRHCGFERSSQKQEGVSVPARWDVRRAKANASS